MKISWQGVTYDIDEKRVQVWQHKGKWRGMIQHSDGSGGISTELVGADNEADARRMLKRQIKEWLEDDVSPEEMGLT